MKSAVSTMTVLTQRLGPDHTLAPLIVPPDGGWGWIIVLTGFLSAVIIDGVAYCFYLFRDPMGKDLSIEAGDIALLSALYTGFYFVGGILACSVGNHFGFRPVMMIGAFSSTLVFSSGYFWNNIAYFLAVIGFIGGLAGGFIFVSGSLPVGFYFDKRRSIAMGLTSCGSGMGAILMPQVTKQFINFYGWRLTYVFHASLFGLMVFMGLLIRPLKPVMVVIKPGSWTSLRDARDREPNRPSYLDFLVFRTPTLDATSLAPSMMARSAIINSVEYPTISQMAQDNDGISIFVPEERSSIMLRLQDMCESRMLQPSASIMRSYTIEVEPIKVDQRRHWPCCCLHRQRIIFRERPMLRTDLYYTGSLNRLEEYTTKDKDMDYHLEVTRVPTYFDTVQDLTKSYTSWCCQNILGGIRILLDYTLLKSPTFDCLVLCGFSNYIAFFLPYLYIKLHLEHMGHGDWATNAVSMIGLGNMLGRCSSGLVVTKIPHFGARTTCIATGTIAAVTIIAATFYHDILYQLACMAIYGFFVGFFAPLRSIIIVDFMGLETLTSATGIMIFFQGCGSFIGAPLAEKIMEVSGNKNTPFYMSGVFLLIGSIALCPMRRIQKWEVKRKPARQSRQPRSTR